MYSPYPHVQGGAGQPGHHAPLPAYNPNVGLPQVQNPSHHPAQPQPQHHMMYNPHQYAHQSPYGAGNPPIMTGMPQMHNGGMAHSGGNGNGVPHYQTPYTSSPYGTGIPTSTAGPGQPQAYQPPYAMNMQQQQQQQHMQQQRMMQPPPPSSTPNSHSGGPSRASPYAPPALPHQMTPPSASIPQFAPHPSQSHQQSLQGQQQQSLHQSHQSISQNAGGNQNHGGQNQQQTTPSTPTFQPPLSPASESLEKKRVTVLLDINGDLLMEIMRLQALEAECRKEIEADPTTDPEKKILVHNDWLACMRRMQANLAYLASHADRSHKHTTIPVHPAYMTEPPLCQTSTSFMFTSPMMSHLVPSKLEDQPKSPNNLSSITQPGVDIHIDEETRLSSLKTNYKKLQVLFNTQDADLDKEVKKESELNGQLMTKHRMQTQQLNSHQGFPQSQQMQSPMSGQHQRLPSQQMPSSLIQNNMGGQMQSQGQQQQMNMMNPTMGMPSMSVNPGSLGSNGMGSMGMPNQMDMGFQRGMSGGMQR